MDKFIRHLQTQQYLTQDGNWTPELEKAWCVKDVGVAVDRLIALGAHDVEICYRQGRPAAKTVAWDYTIPFS